MVSKNKVTEDFVIKDMNSLYHSKLRYKYHIVFTPKYRR